ncbi:hypothetical protein [Candidatus Thiosymbion oneisti]|uniref:hypothetical protein n=1 Tax=Candidatus Thiosymbion oneisti TaxID=589554 RepID=UPI001060F466|nr:hypothetical protein [Candidatus Thiosymbion oneisti]
MSPLSHPLYRPLYRPRLRSRQDFFFTVDRLERRRRLLTDDSDDLGIVFTDARRRRSFTLRSY